MRLFLSCFIFFQTVILIGQNQTFWSIKIPKEYANKLVNIQAFDTEIYFFEDEILISKIEPFHSVKILVSGKKSKLFSQKSFVLAEVLSINDEITEADFELRNTPVPKVKGWRQIMSWSMLSILAIIFFVKLSNTDVFYGFLMPWIAYSNTQELVAKMNTRKMLIPIFVFWIVLIGNLWVFYGYNTRVSINHAVILVLIVFLVKIFLLGVLEFLFANRGFSKAYLIEFLKLSIIFFLFLFFVRLLEILNPFDFGFIYRFLLLFYVFVWFGRIVIIFYREREQKIIHFFSYLCVSEAMPILLLFAFWNS